MTENEKLRGLLSDLRPVATENEYYGLAARIDAALSQRVDTYPTCNGPDYSDGCEKEGFPGGCERMGCCGHAEPAPTRLGKGE